MRSSDSLGSSVTADGLVSFTSYSILLQCCAAIFLVEFLISALLLSVSLAGSRELKRTQSAGAHAHYIPFQS